MRYSLRFQQELGHSWKMKSRVRRWLTWWRKGSVLRSLPITTLTMVNATSTLRMSLTVKTQNIKVRTQSLMIVGKSFVIHSLMGRTVTWWYMGLLVQARHSLCKVIYVVRSRTKKWRVCLMESWITSISNLTVERSKVRRHREWFHTRKPSYLLVTFITNLTNHLNSINTFQDHF
jgi:hypothetical protein